MSIILQKGDLLAIIVGFVMVISLTISDKKELMKLNTTTSTKLEEALNSLKESRDRLSKIESARKNALFTYIQKKYRNIPSLVANEIAEQTVKKCEEHNAPFVVIVGIMETESGFNPGKTSSKRARGLMQVMHDYWGNKQKIPSQFDLHEIDVGIEAGIKIFMDFYNEEKTISGALKKYLGGFDKNYQMKVFEAVSSFVFHMAEMK